VVHQGAVGAAQTPGTQSRETAEALQCAAGTDALAALRGRSMSPGQYGSHSYAIRSAGSHGVSPRTPRQSQVASDLRLSVAVAELHRQAEAERKSVCRQLHHLERRFQDQLSEPVMKRERWADLQGSVNGLLEEVTAMGKRIESLDERLRDRTGKCEELTRQKARDLEQQMYAQDSKAQLTLSTSEEHMKRQSAKVKKVVGLVEEHTRRLDVLEATLRTGSAQSTMLYAPNSGIETRLHELEQRQSGLEDDFRGIATVALEAQNKAVARSIELTPGRPEGVENGRLHDDALDRRALTAGEPSDNFSLTVQRDMAALEKRLTAQLDEHATTIARLRVRSEAQDQRLTAATERVENIMDSPLEALRLELQQLRQQDMHEIEVRIKDVMRRIQLVDDASEERFAELREQVPGSTPQDSLLKLASDCTRHEQVLRRLEANMQSIGAQSQLVSDAEFHRLAARTEMLEQRFDSIDGSFGLHDVASKVDRAELVRMEKELTDSLRHVSQRAATCEARTAAMEQRIEHRGRNSQTDVTAEISNCLSDVSDQVEGLLRRVAALESRDSREGSARKALGSPADSARQDPIPADRRADSHAGEEVAVLRKAINLTVQSVESLKDDLSRVLVQQEEQGGKLARLAEERQDADMSASKLMDSVALSSSAAQESAELRDEYNDLKARVEVSLRDIQKERSAMELTRSTDVSDRQALAERIDDCRKDFEQAMAVSSDADSRWKGVLDSQAKQLADLDSRLAAMQKSSPKAASSSDGDSGEVASLGSSFKELASSAEKTKSRLDELSVQTMETQDRLQAAVELQSKRLAELEKKCEATPAANNGAVARGGAPEPSQALDGALTGRLSDALGRLDDSEVVTVECIKSVESATVAVLEHLDQLRASQTRPMESKNSDKDADTAENGEVDASSFKAIVQEVRELKSQYEELLAKSSPDGGVVERLTSVLGNISDRERAVAALQSKVERALTGTKLPSSEAADCAGADVSTAQTPMMEKLADLEKAMEAEVDALAKHQKELKRQSPLEERVDAVCKRVDAGLQQITNQKSDMSAMMEKFLAQSGSGTSQSDASPAALERKVQAMTELMAFELKELSEHQSHLKQEASRFLRLSSSRDVVSRVDATSSAGVGDQSQWLGPDDQQHRRWETASSSSASTS